MRQPIKDVGAVVACVVDYGNFINLAEKLGETMKHVYYYSPNETEYRDIKTCVFGEGVPHVERIEEFFDPRILRSVDLFVFPDIGYARTQRMLEQMGKAVWGSRDITDIELSRSLFLDVLKQVGLPVPKSRVVRGLAALTALLQKEKDKWVKVDKYRENMETWRHIDYEHSLPMLRYLATTFGGMSEHITFVVQDVIPHAQENGYDGFTVDGRFPKLSFQGYEKKNELYLGTWQEYEEMPRMVRRVNEAMSPLLRDAGYRNFFATEIRNEFFIDPTPRMPGQSGEHQLETMTNMAEVIWAGANGKIVEPVFAKKFAASATLHYKEVPGEHWKSVRIPREVKRWFKLAHYCQDGDIYNFPPGKNDEIGVVIGNGDSIEEAIDAIKAHLKAVENEPIEAEVEEFADLLDTIKEGEKHGAHFADNVPSPASVLEK